MVAAAALTPTKFMDERRVVLTIKTDSMVLCEAYARWPHERNERARLRHPLRLPLLALDALAARLKGRVSMQHVRAHFKAEDQKDKVMNSAADTIAKEVARREPGGRWGHAPPVDLAAFEPAVSVRTAEHHALGEGLLVAGDVRQFMAAEDLHAAAALATDTARSQSAVSAATGASHVRACAKAMVATNRLSPAGQRMLVRVVSGTLPTYAAVLCWYASARKPPAASSAPPELAALRVPLRHGAADGNDECGDRRLWRKMLLLRQKDVYAHVFNMLRDGDGGPPRSTCALCWFKSRQECDVPDTQAHWVTNCVVTGGVWRTDWTRTVQSTLRAVTHASAEACARLTAALAVEMGIGRPGGGPAGGEEEQNDATTAHWTASLGLFRVEEFERAWKACAEDEFADCVVTSVIRNLRVAMMEAAADLWEQRTRVLCSRLG